MDVPTMLDIFESYGFETDDELTEERKVEALNETYWDACGREAWPFLETGASLNFDGTSSVATNSPDDVASILQVWGADGGILSFVRFDDYIETWAATANSNVGTPGYFTIDSDFTIRFYPVPPSGTALTMKYLRVPDELTATSIESDIKFPKRYHRSVLVIGTLSRLAVMQDDTDLGAAYERLYEKAMNTMVTNVFKQQYNRPDYIHVNDPDNWDYS